MKISNIDELHEAARGNRDPLMAIKLKCMDCSWYYTGGMVGCPVTDCPLYPFRHGQNPFAINTEKKNNKQ